MPNVREANFDKLQSPKNALSKCLQIEKKERDIGITVILRYLQKYNPVVRSNDLVRTKQPAAVAITESMKIVKLRDVLCEALLYPIRYPAIKYGK